VKVWEQEDTVLLPPSEDVSSPQPNLIDDLPTRPTISAVPSDLRDVAARPVPLPQDQTRDQIELLDTAQIATYGQMQPAPVTPLPVADQGTRVEKTPPIKENVALPPASFASSGSPVHPQLSMPAHTPFLGLGDIPSGSPMQEHRPGVQFAAPSGPPMQEHRPGVQFAAPSAPAVQPRKSRYPLLAIMILLPVPYPNGWQVQVDHAKSSARFYDSSNTAQVTIAVTNAADGNLAQYLSQQARQLQMTATKSGASATFAGTSWSQMQGTTQQSGANYTTTLLATVHNNHLFTITQLAPSSNYADQEKVNFSYMRDSWRFL
jgi:hypothetical protein